MAAIGISELWQAAAVLLGLQITSFTWRVGREVKVADSGDITWLPPADLINLLAILVSVVCVFALPAIGFATEQFSKMAFGLTAILAAGHSFALAAHYELFVRGSRSFKYFPRQEKIAVGIVFICASAYVLGWVYQS